MIDNKNMILELSLPPVSDTEVLRYAGMRAGGNEFDSLLSECKRELLPHLKGLVVYRLVEFSTDGEICDIGGIRVKSQSLAKSFMGAKRAVVFVATVGLEVDRLVHRYERVAIAKAHMINSLAVERVEALCDEFCLYLKNEISNAFSLTKRFSAGYGDLPLDTQRDVFSLLTPERLIGVSLNDSLMMSPTKSVSAIIGIK